MSNDIDVKLVLINHFNELNEVFDKLCKKLDKNDLLYKTLKVCSGIIATEVNGGTLPVMETFYELLSKKELNSHPSTAQAKEVLQSFYQQILQMYPYPSNQSESFENNARQIARLIRKCVKNNGFEYTNKLRNGLHVAFTNSDPPSKDDLSDEEKILLAVYLKSRIAQSPGTDEQKRALNYYLDKKIVEMMPKVTAIAQLETPRTSVSSQSTTERLSTGGSESIDDSFDLENQRGTMIGAFSPFQDRDSMETMSLDEEDEFNEIDELLEAYEGDIDPLMEEKEEEDELNLLLKEVTNYEEHRPEEHRKKSLIHSTDKVKRDSASQKEVKKPSTSKDKESKHRPGT